MVSDKIDQIDFSFALCKSQNMLYFYNMTYQTIFTVFNLLAFLFLGICFIFRSFRPFIFLLQVIVGRSCSFYSLAN